MMNTAAVQSQLEAARAAARTLRALDRASKDRALLLIAELLDQRRAEVLKANAEDLKSLPTTYPAAFRDRLTLNDKRLDGMIESLRQVAALADPVGEVVEERSLPNGVRVRRVRSPLGVILMIFESRPNVAIEAFSLAFKSGNAILLRAGKEAMRSTGALYAIMREALAQSGAPENAVIGITDPSRELTDHLLTQNRMIDVVVPRGGDALIEHVSKHSSIPVIKNDRGMCHVYVHEDADLAMAEKIVENAKTQRPGVCNAMETLLVHAKVAPKFLPKLHAKLTTVELHADPEALKHLPGLARVVPAGPKDFDTEYLDLKLNVRVVTSLDEAIAHIERHGSRHSEAIVTASEPTARRFQQEIDAAAVYWNASTRFTDGFELGLGGELGISTQKLHVRGPVGLRELTSIRWVMDGVGQTRS